MIYILVTREHAYTVRHYLQTWGRDVRRVVRALTYEELALSRRLVPGAYIFSDLERLGEAQMELARLAWAQMGARGADFKLMNDPNRVLRRFEMLQALHQAGINHFAAYRMNGNLAALRFPVFLRREDDHEGAQSELLSSAEQVNAALGEMKSRGIDPAKILAVEYCDTADANGMYRKYSAFRVGERMVARHVLFSAKKWMLKKADLVDDTLAREELEYVQQSPHDARLREIFDLAHIEYGRIDYAFRNDAIQVWEINTNPTIGVVPNRLDPLRLRAQGLFERTLQQAWRETDYAPKSLRPHRLALPGRLLRSLNAGPRQRVAHHAGRVARWLARRPIFTHPLDLPEA
jgi:hypothetical protein